MNIQGFDPEALACLCQYRWPGNVRELQSVIKEAMLRATGPLVLPEFLPREVRLGPAVAVGPPSQVGEPDLRATIDELLKRGEKDIYAKVIRLVERRSFSRVLQETHGHQAAASERLGLHRSTLRYKLRDLGLSADRAGDDEAKPKAPGSSAAELANKTEPQRTPRTQSRNS